MRSELCSCIDGARVSVGDSSSHDVLGKVHMRMIVAKLLSMRCEAKDAIESYKV